MNEQEQAEALRRDILKHPDWPDQDKRIAEDRVTFVETGAASYEPDSGIVTICTGTIQQLTAEGKLTGPTHVILFSSQLADVEIKVAITDEGLDARLKSEDVAILEMLSKGPQSMEEFLNE